MSGQLTQQVNSVPRVANYQPSGFRDSYITNNNGGFNARNINQQLKATRLNNFNDIGGAD